MARANFEVNITDDAIRRTIRRALEEMDDLRPTLLKPLVYPALLDAEREHFENARFAPLSRRYAKWKAAHSSGKRILENTGGLIASFTEENARRAGNGGGQVKRFEKTRLHFGSTYPSAHLHQAGRGARLPARPPLAPYPIINKYVEAAFREWAQELERQWGGTGA